jgi:hypothetical protein
MSGDVATWGEEKDGELQLLQSPIMEIFKCTCSIARGEDGTCSIKILTMGGAIFFSQPDMEKAKASAERHLRRMNYLL